MSETATLPKSFKPQVSSHGATDARIFFVGGYPLNDDIVKGAALSGFQEDTIDSFLKREHMSVKQVYRSLVVKQKLDYSGTNPKKLFLALSRVDLEAYQNMLFEEIKHVNPNVIVPLDDLAVSAVFPHVNKIRKPKGRKYYIDMYRGSVLPLRNDFQGKLPALIRVIPTLGPQLLNQNYSARTYVRIDYKRIAENSTYRQPIKEYGNLWIAKSAIEIYRFFERGLAKNDGFVTFDVETYGGFLTCISFCFDGYESCSIPLSPFFYPEISITELAMMWRVVASLLAHKIPKCNQNIKYDWTILERHGFFVRNVVHDTMVKAGILYPELPKALDFLTSIYTPMAYYKDEGKEFDPRQHDKERLLIYNAKDSVAAHLVNKKQEAELQENGQHELYHKNVAPLILIYKDIESGPRLLVDDDQRLRLRAKYETKISMNLEVLRSLINNQEFKPSSQPQVGRLVYEQLKFPKRQKTNDSGEKSWKTDKETLDDLMINHPEENTMGMVGYKILARLIVCRKLAKVLEVINTQAYPDNTIGGNFNLAGTNTGRTSCSKTIDEILTSQEFVDAGGKRTKRIGRSLQTISKHGFAIDDEVFDDFEDTDIASDLRSMFVPPKGWVFIEGDGSGAEARVVFVLAEDYDGLASMDRKPKLHAKTAAQVFNIPVESIQKNAAGEWEPSIPGIGMSYYDMGKRIRHAGNLRLGPFRLSQMTHFAKQECENALIAFHRHNPKIQGTFHKQIDEIVMRNRILESPWGRKHQFFDRLTDHLFKAATADIPQGTVSDLTKFTMPLLKENLRGYGALYHFITEQHDGILAMVRDYYWQDYAVAFKRHYERTIDFRRGSLKRDFQLTIPCELSKSSENWQSLKEFHL